jgi:single-strand DNA-binding protein
MNNHIIHGRLVRDPELTPRKNSDSSDRVNFTVAVDRRFGDETDFIDCVAFGKTAELIDKWMQKGREIIVWGEGHINPYTDRNGVKRKSYSIFVDGFDFCGSKSDGNKSTGDSWEKQQGDIPF